MPGFHEIMPRGQYHAANDTTSIRRGARAYARHGSASVRRD